MKNRTLAAVLVAALAGPLTAAAAPGLPPLEVGPDGRSFTAGGAPFLWLGDTAWGLLSSTDPVEVERYLDVRAAQGFTVVQTAIPDGGEWSRVDTAVAEAAERGLRMAITPAEPEPGLGEFLGRRYDDRVVWVLGDGSGDDAEEWSAVADGIAAAAGADPLMTFVPGPGTSSSDAVGAASWLSFAQYSGGLCSPAGHGAVDDLVARLRSRPPVRPVLDAQPTYEDAPDCAGPGRADALDVRRSAYADVFAGAAGHTYGHHAAWAEDPAARAAALVDEGATQMAHLRALTDSRGARTPAPDLLTEGVAGVLRGPDHLLAHAPAGRGFALDTTGLSGDALHAWWFDPRTGEPVDAGSVQRSGSTSFFPPVTGPEDADLDWVLVIDDVAAGLAPPGDQ
ncbi:apiosidase-like domain-containing protein [Pseudonocardia abyssalis]|uniref:DUF4038 domain-containing protein n=1 Tax=Pseudonocardia abyssalis TaxID=2792008 RepID=A0ABS6V0I6_9PSEU|nr:DUF4038 domain-containing protein [Pseudonocardia abyssalis]MBW0115965.1 DUF4038 domain-containing protein [Pseudonocardia abyssalis]MBW0138000.1 DUF4038 domain-containing protein [Pseudonocardia abyssalis]